MTIVLLGLDSAGKTTLLHTLKVASQRAAHGKRRHDPRMRMATVTSTAEEAAFVARPTLGFEESSLQISGYACAVYDLGGSRLGRVNWPSYLDEVHAIVFVVDAADSARLDEAKEVLHATLRNAHVAGKPVLVLANKLDLPGALPAAELAARLELPDVRASPHQVHAVTAAKLDDARTFKAFKWLGSVVASDYPALHARVDKDVAEKKRLEELERTERKKRIEERKAQRDKERADKDAADAAAAAAAGGGSAPPAPAAAPQPPPPHAQVEMQPVPHPAKQAPPPEHVVATDVGAKGRPSQPGEGATVPSTPSAIAIDASAAPRSTQHSPLAAIAASPIEAGGNPMKRLPAIDLPPSLPS